MKRFAASLLVTSSIVAFVRIGIAIDTVSISHVFSGFAVNDMVSLIAVFAVCFSVIGFIAGAYHVMETA